MYHLLAAMYVLIFGYIKQIHTKIIYFFPPIAHINFIIFKFLIIINNEITTGLQSSSKKNEHNFNLLKKWKTMKGQKVYQLRFYNIKRSIYYFI